MNPLKTLNQFGGGKKATLLQSGESIPANSAVTSFIVLEDAAIGTMTAVDAVDSLFNYDNTFVFAAGLLIPLPRPATTFTVTTGAVLAFEA